MKSKTRMSIPANLNADGTLQNNLTGEQIEPISILKNSDIFITSADTNTVSSLATGIAINQYEKKSWDFLKEVSDFNDAESNIYKFINVCDKLYRFEPVIGTAIDLFVNYSISNFRITTDNEELNKIINYLTVSLNKFIPTKDYLFSYPSGMPALAKEIASEWFISGNVFPFAEWRNQDIDGNTYKIPYKIINLNPNSIRIDRTQDFFGGTSLYYFPAGYSTSDANGTTLNYNNTGVSYTMDLSSLTDKEIKLDHRNIYHIKRKYSGYKLWGIPYLTRTFSAVKSKRKLRFLDDTTIEGLANYIIIFKIGSPDKDSPYHKVSNTRLAAFKSLVENPQASNMIVWPHDIDVLTVGPDGKVLEFKEKYEVVDRDIIRSLGVPPVLLDGTGSNAVSWVPILALIERLEDVRDAVSDYFVHLASIIAQFNKLEYKTLDVKWSPSNLRDEKQVKTFLLSFYDRGLLPVETVLEQLDYNIDNIVELKKKESKKKYDELFARPDVPFSPVSNNKNKNTTNRSGDLGRQVDNTFNDNKSVTKASVSATFKDTVSAELTTLYDDLKTTRKIDVSTSNLILARFMRIKNIVDVFIDMSLSFANAERDAELLKKYHIWIYAKLDNIQEELSNNLTDNLLYLRKESVANFVTAGVFKMCNETLNSFCDNVLDSVAIYLNLVNNKDVDSVYIVGNNEQKKLTISGFFDNINFDDVPTLIYRFV